MADGNPPPHDPAPTDRRTPLVNDLDPDGTDPETEGDPVEASVDEENDIDGPDGTSSPGPARPGPDHRRV